MILAIAERHKRLITFFLLYLLYSETVLAAYAGVLHSGPAVWQHCYAGNNRPAGVGYMRADARLALPSVTKTVAATASYTPLVLEGGPAQPEMQQFTPVNASNMVDLFTGDFSYNIPLLDVGGYPVNISYRSGVTMDQEASWVGLGWNINPGSITRNMRGLPDDFNGGADTIRKTVVNRDNKTVGVTVGAEAELIGTPLNTTKESNAEPADTTNSTPSLKVNGSIKLGVFKNTYKGWGIERYTSASITAGDKGSGSLTAGLALSNNTQEGLTVSPSFDVQSKMYEAQKLAGYGSLSLGSSYNSRGGLSGLQISAGLNLYKAEGKSKRWQQVLDQKLNGNISFAYPSFLPTITMPYTSSQFSFTGKTGAAFWGLHPNLSISGYVSRQYLDEADRTVTLPAYGYLNYHNSTGNNGALLDFNREKEVPYRESPPVPHIALPSYTYDVFSISGEGTGGSFRAYRGDIGYVHDHYMNTKDRSSNFSLEIGSGNLFHGGVNLNLNRSVTRTGSWVEDNTLSPVIEFRPSNGKFEAAYFRNPGEKSINSGAFYQAVGGDDMVVPVLDQSSQHITATPVLERYRKKEKAGRVALTGENAVRGQRDKRSQVISYLTAAEADRVALNKYIDNYSVNAFSRKGNCQQFFDEYDAGTGNGLRGLFYPNRDLAGAPLVDIIKNEPVNYNWGEGAPYNGLPDAFSARWTGRIKAPVSGTYYFGTLSDDGVRMYLNDTLVLDDWRPHSLENRFVGRPVNLVAGAVYSIQFDYFDAGVDAAVSLQWKVPGNDWQIIPPAVLYGTPLADSFVVNLQGVTPAGVPVIKGTVTKEKRINSYRKANHISEIDVLNTDGRKYVYGIPVYNLYQKEVTFSVEKNDGNSTSGLAGYVPGTDNSVANNKGLDHYFSEEVIPSYAHSFLLTGILSPDYVDVTGDGVTDDDLGDAIKFSYTKTAGAANPYKWRTPYVTGNATYNEVLKTDARDDRASYIYGTKEMWYLNTIESKNMVAAFFLDNELRKDGLEIDENGNKTISGKCRRLRKIALYNKAEYLAKDTLATPVKTVYFEYSYELCPGYNAPAAGGKLTLKKIWFSYNGNEKGPKNPYVFTYHANNPAHTVKAYDRWGNYKSPDSNPTTGEVISNADYPYVVQDSAVAATNVAAWALSEVTLPSGGRLKVDYESDDYAFVQNKRAMQMCKLAGFAYTPTAGVTNNMYGGAGDNLYAFVKVPVPVHSVAELKNLYLEGINKLYFRLYVGMPGDKWGSGSEYVPCYADIDEAGGCGFSNDTIWVKLQGINNNDGSPGGSSSPLAKAAIQFLRLNLSSKAYPGSDVGENIDLADAVRVLVSLTDNILNTVLSFDNAARLKKWAQSVDLNRSLVRLTNPTFKKYGGGARVKRITVYDNWNAMTQQREATYGQEYTYTTTREVNGVNRLISSGVAAYEPGIGGEENPFHLPIEYLQKVSVMAPTTLGYTEEPLGESYFPSPTVGYSKVRVRSIHHTNTRSANGYEESCFYTAYDFPTLVDRTLINDDTKKRYKPAIGNFFKIDAKHFIGLAQGFKIELNDMHGKVKSQASYAETDPDNAIAYTEYYYKTDNPGTTEMRLSNRVMAIRPDGYIDDSAVIGKDVELLMDMRGQETVVNGISANVNIDVASAGAFPVFMPSGFPVPQRQQTRFRSVAAVKVIQRYGIIDSVVSVDKGSRVTARNLLYDSETGDVLLTQTQNEFDDPVYSFTYPAHWAYDGMALAYQNIGVTLNNLFIKGGRIINGLPANTSAATYFTSGDEVLIAYKPSIATVVSCTDTFATYPLFVKAWVVDRNSTQVGNAMPDLYFIDKDGHAINGNDIQLKIVRSGRRNLAGPAGAVASLQNPVVKENGVYSLRFNAGTKVINASVAHYNQLWKVADRNKTGQVKSQLCPDLCCLRDVLNNLFIGMSPLLAYPAGIPYAHPDDNYSIAQLIRNANNWGWPMDTAGCGFVRKYKDSAYYWLPLPKDVAVQAEYGWWPRSLTAADSGQVYYTARIGDMVLKITANKRIGTDSLWTLNVVNRDCGSGRLPLSDQYRVDSCYTYRILLDTSTGPRVLLNNRGCDSKVIPETYIPQDSVYFTFTNSLSPATMWSNGIYIRYGSRLVQYRTPTLLKAAQQPDNRSVAAYLEMEGISCDSVWSSYCFSAITDTVVNPYVYGMLGNFKADTVYTYYGNRAENSITADIKGNIRTEGTFSDFTPFWAFNNGQLKQQQTNAAWVWTGASTLYNVKGFELENRDPLNRYNAGLYGYNLTLPVALVQNSQYREAAFEGFEDYFYNANTCDSACPVGRHFDFSAYKTLLFEEERHSGKYSLKIPAGDTVGVGAAVTASLPERPVLQFSMGNDSCAGTYLQSLHADSTVLLPSFNLQGGKKIVFSAWVKEQRDCKCQAYTGNKVIVGINASTGNTAMELYPRGNIIEGWQRYEQVIELPAGATKVGISFIAGSGSNVYIDDVRIHPFNANMRSFVYHPVNMRLMAELDENNYATFYEYDDEGTLIRLKKETERGIKTIKETRSALRVDE